MVSTVIECVDLESEVEFFTSTLGARIQIVSPADDPHLMAIEVEGAVIELRRADTDRPTSLLVISPEPRPGVRSPGGTSVEWRVESSELSIPDNDPTMVFIAPSDGEFGAGRAGMSYRDLLPGRWGGRFIASHISIADGGEVADWVHFHRIRFQMIYVAAGWVDVVYEGQGSPFRMEAGDCVLQPPEIRHRVLRSSPGLEVIELGCPAVHDTVADHEMTLPTHLYEPEHSFAGQRFVRHQGAEAAAERWVDEAMRVRDTGISAATGGVAGAVVVSPGENFGGGARLTHDGEFAMVIGLDGQATIAIDGFGAIDLAPRASVALPGGSAWRWVAATPDHEALLVSLPGSAVVRS